MLISMRNTTTCTLFIMYTLTALAADPHPDADKPGSLSKELLAYLNLPDEQLNIGRAAMLISKEQYPEIDVDLELKPLNDLSQKLADAQRKAGTVPEKLDALRDLLFGTEGYKLPVKDDCADFLLSKVL